MCTKIQFVNAGLKVPKRGCGQNPGDKLILGGCPCILKEKSS